MPLGSNQHTTRNTAQVNAKIDQDSNPEPDQHNGGQPIRAQIDAHGKQRTKFVTDCTVQHRASLACIEDNYLDRKEVCQPFFDSYRACRREERERRLEANAQGAKSFWG